MRLWVSGLETSEGQCELKVLIPRQLFAHSINQEHKKKKIKANISPTPPPHPLKKRHIFGNSAVFLFLSSSLNAWLSPQAAQARTVSIHNYANIIIILADEWNMRICLRINRCILNSESWNIFEQRTLLASILFVHLNFESSSKLIYGCISKQSNLENSKKSCVIFVLNQNGIKLSSWECDYSNPLSSTT